MTEKKEQVWVTTVEQIDGAFALDVPKPLFDHLALVDGDRLIWVANEDGTITLARFRS